VGVCVGSASLSRFCRPPSPALLSLCPCVFISESLCVCAYVRLRVFVRVCVCEMRWCIAHVLTNNLFYSQIPAPYRIGAQDSTVSALKNHPWDSTSPPPSQVPETQIQFSTPKCVARRRSQRKMERTFLEFYFLLLKTNTRRKE